MTSKVIGYDLLQFLGRSAQIIFFVFRAAHRDAGGRCAVASAQAGTWSRFKACRKDSCGWIFYDQSRNRSSNWCSMTICGNRSKTAGYRRRKATA